ncbi:nucleotidyl transferase AbiEii/AbiGii toxin family protein [Micromonospora sp. NPDC003197]
MKDFAGDFETHLTVYLDSGTGDDEPLRDWAQRNGVKYLRIVLDRGATPDQPMLTSRGRGTLAEQRDAAQELADRLRQDGYVVTRVKIEAAPWNEDVPQTDQEAEALPAGCYFEHHVKLVLADEDAVAAVRILVEPHDARVSRNARRALDGDRHERFVTQRCWHVGLPTARQRLDDLLAALTAGGFSTAEVEQEFVVYDDNLTVDAGWITQPGLRSIDHRIRPDEPEFTDPAQADRWRTLRRAALDHALALVAASPLRENLVLRGSMLPPAWMGEQAREPGDLDWVLVDQTIEADRLYAELVDLLRQQPTVTEGVLLDVDGATREEDWETIGYESTSVLRVCVPWRADGVPPGSVQLDLALDVDLPEPPVETVVPRGDGGQFASVRAASRELSLAWKIQWLVVGDYTDGSFNEKDLYDAALLAEDPRTKLPPSLLDEVLDPWLEAEDVPDTIDDLEVDWEDFQKDYPWVGGTGEEWRTRLSRALTPMFETADESSTDAALRLSG